MFSMMAHNRQLFFPNFVTLGADCKGQDKNHDLARLRFMLYTPSFGHSQGKNENFEAG